MSEQQKTYEENINRLEELVSLLEKGDVTLEEGLKAFEEGVGLIKVCQQQLERVATKIKVVTQDGELAPLPEQGGGITLDLELAQYLKEKAALVENILEELLPPDSTYPPIIHEAMRYSVFAGGKRLRPILCLAAAEALGKDYTHLLPVAGALELIHTYSLIHDDLPGMDNDDFRRGKPTNHKQFGEGIAILAGDGLLTLAFEALSGYGLEQLAVSPGGGGQYLQVIHEIAQAAGISGMIGGQVMDLQAEGKATDVDTLRYIHEHKTGALFRASIRVGAILSGASEEELAALTAYSESFGLAFQITDDILDITGETAKLGKQVGRDLKKHKATYPAAFGLEKSQEMARKAVQEAAESLSKLPGAIQPLIKLVNYLLERES